MFFKSWVVDIGVLLKTPVLFHCWKYQINTFSDDTSSIQLFYCAPNRGIQKISFRTSHKLCLPDPQNCVYSLRMNCTISCRYLVVMFINHILTHIDPKSGYAPNYFRQDRASKILSMSKEIVYIFLRIANIFFYVSILNKP